MKHRHRTVIVCSFGIDKIKGSCACGMGVLISWPTCNSIGTDSKALLLVLTVAKQICSAMSFLHCNGLVHLDLKPANVLINLSRPGGCSTPSYRAAVKAVDDGGNTGTPRAPNEHKSGLNVLLIFLCQIIFSTPLCITFFVVVCLFLVYLFPPSTPFYHLVSRAREIQRVRRWVYLFRCASRGSLSSF